MRDSDLLRAARKALGIQQFHERKTREHRQAKERAEREHRQIAAEMRNNAVCTKPRPPRFAQPTSVPVMGSHRVWRQPNPVKFSGPKWPEYQERGIRATTRVLFNNPDEAIEA